MSLNINGTGVPCQFVTGTDLCGFMDDPWNVMKHLLGYEFLGQWFYVIIFLIFPTTVYLSTRNGTYAAFASIPMIAGLNVIDDVLVEMSITMMLIAAGFSFYEMIRKRLVSGG